MRNTRFPLPRRYWVYIIICGVLGILLFVNIFSTDALTGEKDFCDFTQRDWRNFALFLLTGDHLVTYNKGVQMDTFLCWRL